MIEQLTLKRRNDFYHEDAKQLQEHIEVAEGDDWLASNVRATAFDRSYLRSQIRQERVRNLQANMNWRAINRGTMRRFDALSLGDITLSLFCLLLAIWIMVIWQSEAPFWWVPGLAAFFVVAAVAALHDAIWQNPVSNRASLRRELRQSRRKLQRLSNRLSLIEVE